MKNKIKIIPIFVPHVGCKNDCVFCNQKRITGKGTVNVNREYVIQTVEEYRRTLGEGTSAEIAFFGGSFTAIDLNLQEELLKAGKYYKDSGVVQRIRMSTRPDAIDEKILEMQKKYSVDIIELGIQSLDDEVLKRSNRGHTRLDSENASHLIREYGFTLGHQVMPGLPGSSYEKDIKTCVDSISMKPSIVRIYPTLIIKDTELLTMYEEGGYIPLSLDEAVEVTAEIYSRYMVNNINVIRIGLQNTEAIAAGRDVAGGPFHAAFRQLVEERLYLHTLTLILKNMDLKGKDIKISSAAGTISNLAGHKKNNIKHLKNIFKLRGVSFENSPDENIIELYFQDTKMGSFHKSDIYKNYLNSEGRNQYVGGGICI